jgi:mono/diheme cytochrome c family protein
MKKALKWIAIVLGSLFVLAFLGFLYFIPPFTLTPPEEFTRQDAAAGPSLDGIKDPVERALAERGKYIVTVSDCSGCHTPLGDEGPRWDEYLAGGNKTAFRGYGSFVTRNLTPETSTGLGRRSNDEVVRVLQSGLLPEARVAHYRDMPWAAYSNWTMEDRHAVVTYLRHLTPVYHKIPPEDTVSVGDDPAAIETAYGVDFAGHAAKH